MKLVNLILLLVLALLQYRLWIGTGSLPDVWRLQEIRAAQADENERLERRNQALAAEVLDLKHGLEAIEERAREEMGMIRPEETFFQIVTLPADEPTAEQN